MTTRKPSRSGQETKNRILDAALQTVREQGLVGTSARAIAKTGDFNQALVFYHFGSIEGLLVAALDRANQHRMERFAEELNQVNDLQGLTRIAGLLHASIEDPDQAALAAIVAGWPSSSDIGKTVLETLQPWNDLVSRALRRILDDHPLAQLVPTDDLAYAIAALFLGIEILGRLDPTDESSKRVFALLGTLAAFSGPVLDSLTSRPSGPDVTTDHASG